MDLRTLEASKLEHEELHTDLTESSSSLNQGERNVKPLNYAVLVCLDGSSFAETILPLAQGIAGSMGAELRLLRVVEDIGELPEEESYMRELAGRFGGRYKFVVSPEPARAIIDELGKSPGSLAAMSTHGRTAWMEAILGSVALKVVRGSDRPILLYRPPPRGRNGASKINSILVALDGSEFSEKIIPWIVPLAKSLKARLTLIQALTDSQQMRQTLDAAKGDVSESAYLQTEAALIKKNYHVEPDWEVLHGEPAKAICRFVHGMPNTMIAMTSHARGGVERVLVGSVAANCIRNAQVPILLYWPDK